VRNAVSEVEQALVNLDATAARAGDAQTALEGYRANYSAVEDRYKNGMASLFELEDAPHAPGAEQTVINLQRERSAAGRPVPRRRRRLHRANHCRRQLTRTDYHENQTQTCRLHPGRRLCRCRCRHRRLRPGRSRRREKVDAPKPALTVTTTKPTATSLPIKLAANGNVAAWQEASVSSESNGLRLTEVRVNVGDVVKAGDVLAVFSPKPSTPTWPRPGRRARSEANAADAAANAPAPARCKTPAP
jgi:biotin carboxyl carrier protein